jgi:hypothetical protein
MTHQQTASFYPITKSPPDDVRLRAFCGVVLYSLLPTSVMVVSASDHPSCSQDSTISEVMA